MLIISNRYSKKFYSIIKENFIFLIVTDIHGFDCVDGLPVTSITKIMVTQRQNQLQAEKSSLTGVTVLLLLPAM